MGSILEKLNSAAKIIQNPKNLVNALVMGSFLFAAPLQNRPISKFHAKVKIVDKNKDGNPDFCVMVLDVFGKQFLYLTTKETPKKLFGVAPIQVCVINILEAENKGSEYYILLQRCDGK